MVVDDVARDRCHSFYTGRGVTVTISSINLTISSYLDSLRSHIWEASASAETS